MSNKKKYATIMNNIKKTNNSDISNIYEKIKEKRGDNDEKKKKEYELKYINDNLSILSDEDLLEINEILESKNDCIAKQKLLLEILNEILVHLGKDPIQNINNFKNIKRTDISSNECKQIVLNKRQEIIRTGFKKNIYGFYNSSGLKNAHINVLKNMCKELGYQICSARQEKMIKGVKTSTTYYFIKTK